MRERETHPNRFFERHNDKLLDFLRHGGGEEHGLPRRAALANDLGQLLHKEVVEDPVRFVHHQHLDVGQIEALRVAQVIDETTGSSDDDVGVCYELVHLHCPIEAAHDQGHGYFRRELGESPRHFINL